MENTIFSKIINKEAHAFVVFENNHCIAIFDKKPVCEGHTLIIPKKTLQTIFDCPEAELAHIIATVKKVFNILQEKLRAEGVNILHASGKAAQQSVDHFHLHIIPRRKHDGVDMWPNVEYKTIDLEKVFNKLK